MTILGLTLLSISLIGIALYSCEDSSENLLMDDTALIEAIQAASKIDVAISDLPVTTQNVIESDFMDDMPAGAQLAPELGYEVGMIRKRGSEIGTMTRAYFDATGRPLNGEGNGLKSKKGQYGERPGSPCFDFVFPITLLMPDETEIILNSEEDFQLIHNWYQENPDNRERPSHVFPFDIVLAGDSTITVTTQEELEALRGECKEASSGRKGKCFTFVLPVTFMMPDSTLIEVVVEDDFSLIREWRFNNPEIDEKGQVIFPAEITMSDGAVVTIHDQEEFDAVKASCRPEGDGSQGPKGPAEGQGNGGHQGNKR